MTKPTPVRPIPERPIVGKRLGRHIEHDTRSRKHAFAAAPLVSRAWVRHAPIFDQGSLGKCTCEAMVGCVMTEPLYVHGRELADADATSLYELATRLDKIPGRYPPTDTGSTGLAAAKAAKKRGWIKAYKHAFALEAALSAIAQGPFMIGINWYEGFDHPQGPGAELVIGGSVRGGHEVQVLAVDIQKKLIRGPQSWGAGWGDHGYYTMGFDTLARLLDEQGDATIPVMT